MSLPLSAEAALHRGLDGLAWRDDATDAYIRDTLELVRDLDGVLTTIKENVSHIEELLKTFQRNLMFERKVRHQTAHARHPHTQTPSPCSQPASNSNVVHAACFADGWLVSLQEGKVYSFEELSDSSAALLSQRHSEMRDVGKEIGKLLSSSNRILKASKASAAWRAYVDYVSDIVIQGFSNAITTTTSYLLQQLDADCLAR